MNRRKLLATGAAVTAAAWVAPEILTLEPAHAAELHSPPPQPHHETETSSGPEPAGTLAFTGAPIEQETIAGAIIIGAGMVAHWVARGER